jgi:hypothetical protein
MEKFKLRIAAIAPNAHGQLGHGDQFFERFGNRPVLTRQLSADGIGNVNRRIYRLVDPEVHINLAS